MGQAHKFVVVLAVGAQASGGDSHAALQLPVGPGLRTVGLLEVVDKLLGGGGEVQLLSPALEVFPDVLDLLLRGLFALLEADKDGGSVAVGHGHPETLGGDGGAGSLDDSAALNMAPHLQGLLLALFLLAADVGDEVIHHFGPALEGFSRAGNGLIGAGQYAVHLVARPHQGGEQGSVALDGTVGLDGDKAPLGAQTGPLGIDNLDVAGVELRHHHGHVLGPAVGGVVGDHRALGLGVPLLQGANFVLFHVHRAEDEVYHDGDPVHIGLGVQHHQGPGLLRDGGLHGPAAGHGLFIGLAGRAGAGGQGGELEPGVVLHQGDKPLAHHAGGADDTYLIFFHVQQPPYQFRTFYVRVQK